MERTPATIADGSRPSTLSLVRHVAPKPTLLATATAATAGLGAWIMNGGIVLPAMYQDPMTGHSLAQVAVDNFGSMTALAVSAFLGIRTTRSLDRNLGLFGPIRRMRASGTAKGIVAALREQWPACGVRPLGMETKGSYLSSPLRGTEVRFPNGSELTIGIRHGARQACFRTKGEAGSTFLSASDHAFIERDLTRLQTREIALEMGLDPFIGPIALSHALALAIPVEAETSRVPACHDTGTPAMTIHSRRIPDHGQKAVTFTVVGSKAPFELYAIGRRTGALRLPIDPFASVTRGDETQRTTALLGVTPKEKRTPVIVGTERADRLIAVARKALARDPDLTDALGTPIADLVETHLPRLMETHRRSQPSVRAQADEELQRGLDVVSRAIGESIDELAGRDLDDLRTEVRFLQSRHPVRDQRLEPVTSETAP